MQDSHNSSSLVLYLECMEEAKHRLAFVERFAVGIATQARVDTESACLQFRKVLELIAYAAIVPQKAEYETWRQQAVQSKDFRKDYNGRKILRSLAQINPYSYPRPLLPPFRRDGAWHFEKFHGEYLTKGKYEQLYDKCGSLLHADNPWGNTKPYEDFRKRIPEYIRLTTALLRIHGVIIQDETGSSAWVVELGDLGTKAKGIIGQGTGGLHISKDYYE